MSSLPATESPSALTLRATLLIATGFWIYAAVTTVARWDLLKEAIPRTPAASWQINTLTCVILWPVLLAFATVSHRVGYELARWPRVVAAQVSLALLFGLAARPAFALAWTLMEGGSVGATLARIDGQTVSVTVKLWGNSVLEDAVQYIALQGVLASAAFYVRMRHEQQQRERLSGLYDRARLQALRMQTNPHFLFNTLSAIAGLIRAKPEAAEAMVTRLGDLFRSTLSNRDADFVPLARELQLGEEYLAIQAERFEERLRYVIEAEAQLGNVAIPPLLLQPLLENAVEHGLTTQEGAMLIEVRCAGEAGRVTVTVRNGIGPAATSSSHDGSGFGLDNVKARLEAAFGDTAEFGVGLTDGGHFEACIRFPARLLGTPAAT